MSLVIEGNLRHLRCWNSSCFERDRSSWLQKTAFIQGKQTAHAQKKKSFKMIHHKESCELTVMSQTRQNSYRKTNERLRFLQNWVHWMCSQSNHLYLPRDTSPCCLANLWVIMHRGLIFLGLCLLQLWASQCCGTTISKSPSGIHLVPLSPWLQPNAWAV